MSVRPHLHICCQQLVLLCMMQQPQKPCKLKQQYRLQCKLSVQVQPKPSVLVGHCVPHNPTGNAEAILPGLVRITYFVFSAFTHKVLIVPAPPALQCRNCHPVRPLRSRGIQTYYPNKRFMKAVLDFRRLAAALSVLCCTCIIMLICCVQFDTR